MYRQIIRIVNVKSNKTISNILSEKRSEAFLNIISIFVKNFTLFQRVYIIKLRDIEYVPKLGKKSYL